MDATQATSAAPITNLNTTGSGATSASTKPAVSSDFETFLKMLAVQLQNQDPLNPVDSSDYAVQLATFSSVEQQVLTNDLLEGLAAKLNLSGMADYASWVGMEARSTAPVHFDGSTPIEIAPNPLAIADRAVLVVYDDAGNEVARRDLPISADNTFWDGRDGGDNLLPAGQYAFALESYSQGDLMATDPVESYARITEAQSEHGQTIMVLEGGILVSANGVTALRQPG